MPALYACHQVLLIEYVWTGVFAREWIMDEAKHMPAYLWWDQHGASVPELQAVARMVLAQPAC